MLSKFDQFWISEKAFPKFEETCKTKQIWFKVVRKSDFVNEIITIRMKVSDFLYISALLTKLEGEYELSAGEKATPILRGENINVSRFICQI